ncbi:MAG: hypothetical protein Q8M23_07180 [Bacteroidales bacterium]|nr:hypothetical protein [Bacteroidales bacterium]
MRISFSHKVDGELLQEDQMIYTNAAGNRYEVIEVMYFLSDLKLHRNDGTTVAPASWNDIHYVDTHIPSTFLWTVPGEIPPGTYDSITFTFGIAKEKNKSFLFVNPPEVNMAWPDVLGGGYHYLMLNGWWRDLVGVRQSFNFHLGIGQIYQNNSGQVQDIIGFVHNAFTLTPTGPSFTIGSGQTLETELTMHLESWFSTPHVYDHNYWGGAIMQNQAAMQVGCENGRDAFTVEYHQAE